jgi:hypothetical protein
MSYAREERSYWYTSSSNRIEDKLLQSEHLLSTTTYAAD